MTKRMNRRTFGRGVAATGLTVLAAPSLLRPAHAQAGELNIWSYDGFVTDALRQRFEGVSETLCI